jgi:OOP family OmpA-OmpF porin
MTKISAIKTLISIMVLFFLIGCAEKEYVPLPSFSETTINTNLYNLKIDNFLIVFDASSSMRHSIREGNKLDVAKALVYRMNKTIPEMGQTAGLRSFGHASNVSTEDIELQYGMTIYSTNDLKTHISKAGGLSRLNLALDAAQVDFEGLSNYRNAVIIISDGLDLDPIVLDSAQNLKDEYGSNICFYTIQVGNDIEGKKVLEQIADIGGCGFYSGYEDLVTTDGMTAFILNEFLVRKPMKLGVVTPKKIRSFSSEALFDFDKADIKIESYPMLDEVVTVLEKNRSMNVMIQGHTDYIGDDTYNMELSLKRANVIKAYLVDHGIAEYRLKTKGFGSSKPISSDRSKHGRSLNRRVDLYSN